MSHLAIATVTRAIQQRLTAIVDGVDVICSRPSDNSADVKNTIFVFLFSLSPNLHRRNMDLPTRSSSGEVRKRPILPLDLYYLLTFRSNSKRANYLEDQEMIGKIVINLYEKPRLSREEINSSFDFFSPNDSSVNDFLDTSVKLELHQMDVDEFSRLWTLMGDIPYDTSLIFKASVAILQSELAPYEQPPVKKPSVKGLPEGKPEILDIVNAIGKDSPIFADSTIVISGKRFIDSCKLLINDNIRESVDFSEGQAMLDLNDEDDIQPGILTAQVIRAVDNDDGESVTKVTSSKMKLKLRPRIDDVSVKIEGNTIEIIIDTCPAPSSSSQAELNLMAMELGKPRGYHLTTPKISDGRYRFILDNSDIRKSEYIVTIKINGVSSPFNSDKRITIT